MKSLTLSQFRPLNFFIRNRKITSFLSILLTLSFLNLIFGCSYYNVRDLQTTPATIENQVNEFANNQKYVIIHSGQDVWHLGSLEVNQNDKTLSGIIEELGDKHIQKQPRDSKKTHRYTDNNKQVLNEVHFYITETNIHNYGDYLTIPFSEINLISVNDKNTGRKVLSIVGGVVGAIALIAIIVALTKSSCPFIYVNDGGEYVFTGELYPGVLTSNQQHDDYILLPKVNNATNEYEIKISNELKEVQYTDFVQLLEVAHAKNVQVLLDQNGNVYTFSNIISPTSVVVDDLTMDNQPVFSKDGNSYLFNTQLNNASNLRSVELHFNNPQQSAYAKLFLTVKNSLWLDYVFGKFNEKFGSYYPEFQKNQQNVPSQKSINWKMEQNIPLSVYLKTKTGWDLVSRVDLVGPMATRDLAIPINLNLVDGIDIIIKLETGFMFWEVDYAGIDFTKNEALNINYINPSSAVDNNNVDVKNLLLVSDNDFFVQPNIGDEVIVTFNTNETNPELTKTYFLKNRGYYNYIRNYKGEPNIKKLKLFKEPGAFTEFSKLEYEALINYENLFDLIASYSN